MVKTYRDAEWFTEASGTPGECNSTDSDREEGVLAQLFLKETKQPKKGRFRFMGREALFKELNSVWEVFLECEDRLHDF